MLVLVTCTWVALSENMKLFLTVYIWHFSLARKVKQLSLLFLCATMFQVWQFCWGMFHSVLSAKGFSRVYKREKETPQFWHVRAVAYFGSDCFTVALYNGVACNAIILSMQLANDVMQMWKSIEIVIPGKLGGSLSKWGLCDLVDVKLDFGLGPLSGTTTYIFQPH